MVLLVDSMSTSETFIPGKGTKVTTYDHAMKLFELGAKGNRAAVMISGVGDVGGTLVSQLIARASRNIDGQKKAVTHETYVSEVKDGIDPVYQNLVSTLRTLTLQQIQTDPSMLQNINEDRKKRGLAPYQDIKELTEDKIAPIGTPDPKNEFDVIFPAPPLDVVVASHVTDYAASFLKWPSGSRQDLIRSVAEVGRVWWFGSGGGAVSRIVKGYDANLVAEDSDAAAGAAAGYFEKKPEIYQMPLLLSVMPLQEAVYFTEYLGDVSCGYDRFKSGPAGVGGAVNVMVITDQRRKWLRKDRIQSRPSVV
jgi:hypothetical protein